MRPLLAGVLVSSGIDYITTTTKPGRTLELARKSAFRWAELELQSGMFGRPWQASGYEGFKVGQLCYGERGDGCMVRLSSELAAAHWLEALTVSDNVTRIDLQGTFRLESDPAFAIVRHYKELKRHTKRRAKGPAVSMLVGHDGSRTVYSGRRASDAFGRIYDKARESKQDQWAKCIRYELELKGRRASAVSHRIATGKTALPDIAFGALRFFRERGCALAPLLKSMQQPTNVFDLGVSIRMTDIERSLTWLRTQVRPTVIALNHRGLLQSVVDSLSLQDLTPAGSGQQDAAVVH